MGKKTGRLSRGGSGGQDRGGGQQQNEEQHQMSRLLEQAREQEALRKQVRDLQKQMQEVKSVMTWSSPV